MKEWLWEVAAHPAQVALSKGAQKAVSCMTAECVLLRINEIWAVSIDVTKMFNMLSANIALMASQHMGLHEECCQQFRRITGF